MQNAGVEVIAASVDSRDDAADTVDDLELDFPVAWGLDAGEIVRRYGAYAHEDGYLQPLNILLLDGEIEQVTYSSGPLGRLQPDEVLDWVEYVEGQAED